MKVTNKALIFALFLLLLCLNDVLCIIPMLAKLAIKGAQKGMKVAAKQIKKAALKAAKQAKKEAAKMAKRAASQAAKEAKKSAKQMVKEEATGLLKRVYKISPPQEPTALGKTQNELLEDAMAADVRGKPEAKLEYEFRKAFEKNLFQDAFVLLKHYKLYTMAGEDDAKRAVATIFLDCYEKNYKDFRRSFRRALNSDSMLQEYSYLLMYTSITFHNTNSILDLIFREEIPSGKLFESSILFLRRILRIHSKELHEALQFYLIQFYERDQKSIVSIMKMLESCSTEELGVFFNKIFTPPFQKTFRSFLSKVLLLPQINSIPREWVKQDLAVEFFLDPVQEFHPTHVLLPMF